MSQYTSLTSSSLVGGTFLSRAGMRGGMMSEGGRKEGRHDTGN